MEILLKNDFCNKNHRENIFFQQKLIEIIKNINFFEKFSIFLKKMIKVMKNYVKHQNFQKNSKKINFFFIFFEKFDL